MQAGEACDDSLKTFFEKTTHKVELIVLSFLRIRRFGGAIDAPSMPSMPRNAEKETRTS